MATLLAAFLVVLLAAPAASPTTSSQTRLSKSTGSPPRAAGSVPRRPPAAVATCPGLPGNGTLLSLDGSDPHLQKLPAKSAAECCQLCFGGSSSGVPCYTWSFTHFWGAGTPPCHLSALAPLHARPDPGSCGGSVPAPSPPPPVPPGSGSYTLLNPAAASSLRQTIEGIGFEIQADSIGSGTNPAVGSKISGVPHDLVASERLRLNRDMLRGFRTCRLALGLYVRGLDAQQQHIVQRWPTQMAELVEMQAGSGIEGFDVEYWSAAPYWKGPKQAFSCSAGDSKYPRWSTKNASFVGAWSDAMQQDAVYLQKHGLKLAMWGLQNEPSNCPVYGTSRVCAVSFALLCCALLC